MNDDRKETTDNSTKPYHSAGWAMIDKNSGVIQVRWWVPLVIIVGAFLILCMSCSLIWGYRKISSQNRGSSQSSSILENPNPNSKVNFANMQEAEDAYMDLYDQIDGFCKTVKSPS